MMKVCCFLRAVPVYVMVLLVAGLYDFNACAMDQPNRQQANLQNQLYLNARSIKPAQEIINSIRPLLAAGADPALPSRFSETGYPIIFDIMMQRILPVATPQDLNILDTLLHNGTVTPDIVTHNTEGGETLTLLQAVLSTVDAHNMLSVDILRRLIAFGARLNTKNDNGETTIHWLLRRILQSSNAWDANQIFLQFNHILTLIRSAYPDEETFLQDLCVIDLEEPLRSWGVRSFVVLSQVGNVQSISSMLQDTCRDWKHEKIMQVLPFRNKNITTVRGFVEKVPVDALLELAKFSDAPKASPQPNAPNIVEQAVKKYGESGKFEETRAAQEQSDSTAEQSSSSSPSSSIPSDQTPSDETKRRRLD